MDAQIQPARLHGAVRAIPSKSQAHRALISAALAGTQTHIVCEGESEDIAATLECLNALGADIRRVENGFMVRPILSCGKLDSRIFSARVGCDFRAQEPASRVPRDHADREREDRAAGDRKLDSQIFLARDSYGTEEREDRAAGDQKLDSQIFRARVGYDFRAQESASRAPRDHADREQEDRAAGDRKLDSPIFHARGGCDFRAQESASRVFLPCGESGSTFRFLLPVACALGRSAAFLLKGRLSERPLSPLAEVLTSHGCVLSPKGSVPFCTDGQLAAGLYALDAGVSSQFVSGLLFALPLLGLDSEVRLLGKAESLPYIELTMAMLRKFAIRIEFDGEVFSVPGKQKYISPGEVHVEGDWSNAAFWLSAGAMSTPGIGAAENRVACACLDTDSRQGDRVILDILARFGARIETDGDTVSSSGGKLRGIEIDARDCPDLVPILAVVGTAAEGETVIRNAARLRTKESDRLAATTEVLRALGGDVTETGDGLRIRGGRLTGGEVSSWGDHRIAMAAAIAATVCRQSVTIRGAEAVNKSYPGFFRDLGKLGAAVTLTA